MAALASSAINFLARPYSAADVLRLRGSVLEEHTLARLGAERLWTLLAERPYVPAQIGRAHV